MRGEAAPSSSSHRAWSSPHPVVKKPRSKRVAGTLRQDIADDEIQGEESLWILRGLSEDIRRQRADETAAGVEQRKRRRVERQEQKTYVATLKKDLDEKFALVRYVEAVQKAGGSSGVNRKLCRVHLHVGKDRFTELIDSMETDRFDDELSYPELKEELNRDIAGIRRSLVDEAAEPAGSDSDGSGPLCFR